MLGDRTLTLYLLIFSLIGTGGILFFWVIGAVMLLQNNGGQIIELGFGPLARTLFLSFPIVAGVLSVIGLLLYWGKRDTAAVGVAGLPIVGTVLFYLALTFWGGAF